MISPLLDSMELVKCIGARGGTSVYIVRSQKSGQSYILKHIRVPESRKQVDALIYTGAAENEEQAQAYYQQVVTDYQTELETLEKLSESPNLGCFRSYQIVPKEDEVGFEVYLLAEYRKTLVDYLHDNAMTHSCAISLGLDLCSALMDLRDAGLIHRDVKPSNVYLTNQGHFLLGDLGLAKIEELKFCSMPESMLSSYSAPELFSLIGSIEPTTDIYSVGMILYRIYNGGHGPFEDENTSARAADKKRVTGEALPTPMYADYELSEIILKACAFSPQDRYQTPEEFKAELLAYAKRNEASDTLIVPPIAGEPEPIDPEADEEAVEPVSFADAGQMPEDFKQSFSPDTQMLNSIIDSVHKEASGKDAKAVASSLEPAEDEPEADAADSAAPRRRRRRKKWIAPLVCGVLLIAALVTGAYFLFFAPKRLHVESINVLESGLDYLTVAVDSPEKNSSFNVVCTDQFGTKMQQPFFTGSTYTFDGLVSGSQYTISAESAQGEEITGISSITASTVAKTEILSFTATPISLTQAELNLIILDGPDPGSWTVSYYAEGVDAKSAVFEGHTAVIGNLESNKEYTFALQPPEGTQLSGQTTVSFSTVPTVELDGNPTVALSSSTAILSWKYTGEAPEAWTVVITAPDGSSDTQVVSAPTVTFENLTSGQTYEILISAPSMLYSVSTKITPTVPVVTNLTASILSDENDKPKSVRVKWACEADPTDPNWTLTYWPNGMEDLKQSAESAEMSVELPLSALVPGAEYDFSLTLKSGDSLDGETRCSVSTPEAEKFSGHGLSSVYTGLFLTPTQENWTYLNLATARTWFRPTESIAYAVEAIQTIDAEAESMDVLAIVRSEDGKLVDLALTQTNWSAMWEQKKFVGSFPRTPQTAGKYTLELLLNGQLLTSASFEIRAS